MHYFQLLENDKPVRFKEIDERVRKEFNAPTDTQDSFYQNWYSILGTGCCLGLSRKQIIEAYPDYPELQRVIGWVLDNYTPASWRH